MKAATALMFFVGFAYGFLTAFALTCAALTYDRRKRRRR